MTETTAEPPSPAHDPGQPRQATNVAGWLHTPAAKIGMILCLLLLMQVPLAMVSGLIREREARQSEALANFRHGWGPEQTVAGPVLMVPYTWSDPAIPRADPSEHDLGWARLAPAQLHVDVRLQPETRRRGLFRATVYTATVGLGGSFTIPDAKIKDAPAAIIDWARARVVIGASDLRGMTADAAMDLNGGKTLLQEGDTGLCGLASFEAPANLGSVTPGTEIPFKAALTLHGTQAFWLLPEARQVDMRVASPWPTPGFTGATFPLHYDVGKPGFDATWEMAGGPAMSGWQHASGCKAGVPPTGSEGLTGASEWNCRMRCRPTSWSIARQNTLCSSWRSPS